jgi:hypothetical protein
MSLEKSMGVCTTFLTCVYKLANDAINSTSFIHVYDHVKVAKCQDLQSSAQQQSTNKMFDGCGS